MRADKAKPHGSVQLLASGQPGAQGIAADASGIYWANYPTGDIVRLALGSTSPERVVAGPAGARDIAVDGEQIYWTVDANPTSVRRVNRDGSGEFVLCAGGADIASELALDAKHVYWVSRRAVMRAPREGGPIETVATHPVAGGFPHGLALDTVYVYWILHHGGPVLRATKP